MQFEHCRFQIAGLFKFNFTYFSHNYHNYSVFRDVPECSICLVLSTTFIARAARPNLGFHSGCPKGRPSLGFGRMSTFHAEFWTHHMVQATSMPCGHPAKHVCKILNNFLLLNRFLRLSSNENLLLLNFLSHFFHLVPCIWKFQVLKVDSNLHAGFLHI